MIPSRAATGRTLTRRALLGAGTAVGLSGALAGCSNEGRGGTTGANDAASKSKVRPAYIPYQGVEPDMAGATIGIPDAFNKYPAEPVQAIDAPPGDGEPIKVMTFTNTPIPPKLSRNDFWQEFNKRAGSPLELDLTPSVDYDKKFATAVAGDKLGELFMIGGIPQKPQMLAAKAVDLTPHLAGDKIKKYPFLANLADASWNAAIFDGKIYGIPIPRGAISSQALYARKDILDDLGLSTELKSADDFVQLCKELSNKRKNQFALANVPTQFVQNMFGIANSWTEEGGKLVSNREDPAQQDALALLAKLWKAGYIHPDAFASQNQDMKTRFGNGTSALVFDTFSGWPGYLQTMPQNAELAVIPTPAHDGSGVGKTWLGAPTIAVTAISKKAEDRVETLLSYLNYLATPFGTSEYLFRRFGIEGVDHEISDGNPVLTDKGLSETQLSLGYQADAPWAIFLPDRTGSAQACFDAMKKICPDALTNPVAGMYSETENRKGGQLNEDIGNITDDIIQGRKPVSAWAPAVKKWKAGGGDKIADELYAALKSSR
ncbi:type 2 periplasmic-binding domain-containing protein [Microlunatus soli]|uniref:Putative aldouronate transport system substrate-binding protein n=1 Tax=Microlunatus soli TaxID=630515 RepID=A0A1H1MB76_9ACTN|nr:extracellular solute-binding protein [Microlunatus soli]SDR83832.1 putative aldouronate transport system substrate-binding protein [Microlunatus soli]